MSDPQPIRSNTVLPADREPLRLQTADGLVLVGELARPRCAEPSGTIVCLHPLPTQGGSMESHLLRKMAWRLPALAGLAVLRFNTRGTDGSQGHFDGGDAERYDVDAALAAVRRHGLPRSWLVGWSFGTELALRYGCRPDVRGAILLSPPLKRAGAPELRTWAQAGTPLIAIVPERDDYLPPAEARQRFGAVPQARVVEVPRARHLFVGFADEVLDEVVRAILPDRAPLPRTYPGTASDSTEDGRPT